MINDVPNSVYFDADRCEVEQSDGVAPDCAWLKKDGVRVASLTTDGIWKSSDRVLAELLNLAFPPRALTTAIYNVRSVQANVAARTWNYDVEFSDEHKLAGSRRLAGVKY